jgi:hypothetical protein
MIAEQARELALGPRPGGQFNAAVNAPHLGRGCCRVGRYRAIANETMSVAGHSRRFDRGPAADRVF